jgi:hypothetical protein
MFELILKFDEIYKRNPISSESVQDYKFLKFTENQNNFNFIGNKRKNEYNEFDSEEKPDENKSPSQYQCLSMNFSKSSPIDRKEKLNFPSLSSSSTTPVTSLNKVSSLKNLKVKIPKERERKDSEGSNKQSYQTDDSKFPKVIDKTKEDTREFINLLKELNKQDLTMQDKQRMENYLSKSISEMQKKISSDLQKMNGNNLQFENHRNYNLHEERSNP